MLVHSAIERDLTVTEPNEALVVALYYDKEPETDEEFQQDVKKASASLGQEVNQAGSELKPNKVSMMARLLRYEFRCVDEEM